jgi:hypothetical protein
LKILGDEFALSSNPNARNGGFIGLAASSIALGKVCYLQMSHGLKLQNVPKKTKILIF